MNYPPINVSNSGWQICTAATISCSSWMFPINRHLRGSIPRRISSLHWISQQILPCSSFYISNNQLTSLDVTNNKELVPLECSNNQLTSLNTSNNPELWLLDCGYNQIATLDVTNNTKVYQFYINGMPSLTRFASGKCHSLLKLIKQAVRIFIIQQIAVNKDQMFRRFFYKNVFPNRASMKKSGIWPVVSMCTGIFMIMTLNCEKTTEKGFADIDGNVYDTVVIGTQVWMAKA